MQGTVTRLNQDGKFGFIQGEDGAEYFFHMAALKATEFGEIAPGSRLLFDVDREPGGDRPDEHPRAIDVILAPEEVPADGNERLPPEKTGGV
jgi:cold shock CspA family protein